MFLLFCFWNVKVRSNVMYLVENYNVIFRILMWFSKYCQFYPIWPWIPKYHFLIVYMLSMQTVAVRIWESNIGLLSLWHLDQFDCEGEVSYFKSLFGTLLFRLIIDLEGAGKCKLHFNAMTPLCTPANFYSNSFKTFWAVVFTEAHMEQMVLKI